nr:hypothetical protein [uncultured Desulfobacter sp.]
MEVKSIAQSPSGKDEIYMLGREGECLCVSPNKKKLQMIEPDTPGVGPFRKIKNICGALYVLGEEKSVWHCQKGQWTKLAKGIPSPDFDMFEDQDEYFDDLIEKSEVAFSLSGKSTNDLCMTCTTGQAWFWDGHAWAQDYSLPTNQNLYDICKLENGKYIICGGGGTLIEGERARWNIIETFDGESDLISVCQFKDSIYVSDGQGLSKLHHGKTVPVDFGLKADTPSHIVVANHDLVLSIAAKEVFFSKDGDTWFSLLM